MRYLLIERPTQQRENCGVPQSRSQDWEQSEPHDVTRDADVAAGLREDEAVIARDIWMNCITTRHTTAVRTIPV
ncbi:hypothetical protein BV898_07129 [Hypsibius exemplaris]|uniref:Uncharacterized protein n=1 Tax=Hypsibius exemplaris TaxID=2072580 RepID=A0A1W0WUK1_HYPEX|nr:hypothetical protein BV898_07129 [Hypsibius exemplaris]